MNTNARLLAYLVATVVAAFILLSGCQKNEPTTEAKATQMKAQRPATSPATHEATSVAAQQVAQVAEQTTCPVMGGAFNKDIFVEYQGKKVYFCCAGCVDVFKADPEKYVSKLPQFAK